MYTAVTFKKKGSAFKKLTLLIQVSKYGCYISIFPII